MEANVIVDGELWNYHVTKDGKVFSLNYNKTREVKELKNSMCKGDYRRVCMYKDGKSKMMRVSRLVALAYIENPENKPEVDHINRIRTDDRVENLRWATRSEQIHNRKEYQYPKNHKGSKPVMCVETGIVYPSTCEVKRQLGFNQGYISACCRGEYKTAYGYHWQYKGE